MPRYVAIVGHTTEGYQDMDVFLCYLRTLRNPRNILTERNLTWIEKSVIVQIDPKLGNMKHFPITSHTQMTS
jgi:hypothetical protein